MTDFIHCHVHALYVVGGDVIVEASRLVLMAHEEAQVARFGCCAQRDVHWAKVNANVKHDWGSTRHALLILVKDDIGQRGICQVNM